MKDWGAGGHVAGGAPLILAIAGLSAGGAERVMTELANQWVARARPVTLVTWSEVAGDHYMVDPRIRRRSLEGSGSSRNAADALLNNLRRWWRLRRAFAEDEGRVVVSFGEGMNVLCVLASIGTKVRVVACERNDPRQHHIGRLWSTARRVAYPFASRVVVQTESVREWAIGVVRPDRVFVIPNPVRECDCAHDPIGDPLREQRKHILAAGRLVEQKGFDVLLRSFQPLAAERPDWHLSLLGEGHLRHDLEGLANRLGISDCVTFHGVVPDPERYMAMADIFVLSSRYEGFPNVLLEAMACGLPVISTECPSGPSDIITDGRDGMLVPVDDIDSLSEAIRHLAADEPKRHRLGQAARGVKERFSVERILASWDVVLADAMAD